KRLNFVIERRKHHTAAGRNLELIQAMFFGIEFLRHTAVDLTVLLDTTSEWHSLQVSLECVAPLMIGANQFAFITVPFATELHSAVRTYILHHVDATVSGPCQDN